MKNSVFAQLSLLFVAFIWGVTFVVVQNAISFLQPFSFNGIRFLLAACLLWGWLLLFKREQLAKWNRNLVFSGVFIGIWLYIGYAFQTLGLVYTSSSKAGFITGLSVVIVPFLAFLLLKEQPRRQAVIGVLVATIGLYLLTMTDSTPLNIGDGFVLIGAFGFALHIIFTSKYSRSFPTLLLTALQITTVACLSIISAFLFEDWKVVIKTDVLFSLELFFAFIVTAFLATALAFFIQTNVQKYTTPTRVALIFATEPVFAAIAGYFWANDRLSASAIIGCILILFGMVVAELRKESFSNSVEASYFIDSNNQN